MSESEGREANGSNTCTGPLSGIRVLDLTRVLSGPFATMILADLGADVIKVEEPTSGDDTRHWGPPFVGEESAYFLSVNRNKRSIGLDLKSPEGRTITRRLALSADVLVENFRPGVAAKLGLGYGELAKDNPGLIYASISGYGQNGPESAKPGYDPIMQARSGLMSITGEQDGQPSRVGVASADISAGMWAAIGVLAAMQHRQQSGRGQWLDLSLLDAQVSWLANVAGAWFANGVVPQRYGTGHPSIVPSEAFHAKDGMVMLAVGNDRMWQRFVSAIGAPDLGTDERFTTNRSRVQNRDDLHVILESLFAADLTQSWVARLNEAGIPAAPVNTVADALTDPLLADRGMIVELEHPEVGPVRSLGSPVNLNITPPSMRRPPPMLGEHTGSILQELGLSRDEVRSLTDRGVVRADGRDVK